MQHEPHLPHIPHPPFISVWCDVLHGSSVRVVLMIDHKAFTHIKKLLDAEPEYPISYYCDGYFLNIQKPPRWVAQVQAAGIRVARGAWGMQVRA